jgi:preprotein translocase subunit SecB
MELLWNATDRFSSQNQAWLRAMVKLKTNKDSLEVSKLPFKGLRSLLYSKDHARVWLKLGLYLNQPDILYPFMRRLPSDYIADEEIRELMGMIYYRDGEACKKLSIH